MFKLKPSVCRSLREGTRLTEIETVRAHVPRHSHAICALTVAGLVEPQLIHCAIVKRKSLFALVEAVMHGVRRHLAAMITIALTYPLNVACEAFSCLIQVQIYDSIEC